ncbi:histidine kinase [Polaribacter reichenbachii]|uniref:histidine kinase n=1 Tax=Polaribacter reichenbachii TaxID=996801 RepID=A0A1B8U4E7_9FLAO|nr:ATP-binding protein [Polaribacter reichenbachii]APZ47487.1 histidine kinase [Polaribacter reichenbachii]AUC18126.1 histidine kinase [Polaribacter reichenbachii]OBY66737.1 histidine kinase [Polaribacter reichenbachii]
MSQEKIDILERALLRQKTARKQAEKILEEKSLTLYNTSLQLKEVNKKLESLLDEKKSELKGVFENINDAYLVIGIQGNVLKMNDVAEQLFGLDPTETEANILDLIFEEDYTYAMNSFLELKKKGKFSNFSARVTSKNNEIKWVNINASIIYDKNNMPIAAQGIVRDVTKQREEQLVIDLVNNTAKSVLGKENINEIAWEITSNIANYLGNNDCVLYLVNRDNNTLEQIAAFGEKVNDSNNAYNNGIIPLGKGISGSVALTGISEIIDDTSKDKRYISDDKIRSSEITVPIISNGEVIGIIDAEHEHKNYFTAEHKKTIENIANIVSLQLKSAINLRERIKVEQHNKDLVAELRRSNDELKEYAHIVSHDLKSPLRSISALSTWIKMDNEDKFDEISLQNFDNIDLTLEKMENLITDILRFSSINSNAKDKQEIDLDNLVKKLIHIMYVPDNISINIVNKLPIVNGDSTKFEQLFQNLIGNAIKFSNKPNAYINIDFEEQEHFYKFSVIDNGIGIEKRHHDKIFKIFQSLKISDDSTGIGLSIVKKIVDIYKGEVWVESEIDKGTTFYFTIKKSED